jgi:hypothetical protein
MKRTAKDMQAAAAPPARSKVEGKALSRSPQVPDVPSPDLRPTGTTTNASQVPCLLSGIGIRIHFQTRG